MIKTFEQFVAAKYGKPVNEGFQSSKLREIIKQHGLPKSDWDKKMLYDIQDNEVVDVVNSRDEYKEKYSEYEGYGRDEATFMIELEDGYCLVIGNLGILKDYFKDRERSNIFKKRHEERHKGNLGKHGGDEIHKKHLEKVDELERKRLAKKLQPIVPEIAEKIKSIMDDIIVSEWVDEEDADFSSGITIGGEEYTVYMYCSIECSNGKKQYGAEYYDASFTLDSFDIENEDGYFTTNEDLGITEETYKDLFEPIIETDIEGEIYDHYAYYGVSRSDFY